VHNVVDGVDFLSLCCFFEIVGVLSGEENSECCGVVL
jgi:hypothetical protein